ncbi:MAG: GNAT family N-acetyltransferase [Chloroflexota bacterium]
MTDMEISLRAFTWADLSTVADLVNRSEGVDQVERGTSRKELETRWRLPGAEPENNRFLAVNEGEIVGYGRLDEISTRTVHLQAVADRRQEDAATLYLSRGMEPVRYFFLSAIYPERKGRLGREEGWVEALAVLREHRRKGLGRALLL